MASAASRPSKQNPAIAQIASKNLRCKSSKGQVQVLNLAVGDEEGTVGFQRSSDSNSGIGHVDDDGDIRVRMSTLDRLFADENVDVMIIDVEGLGAQALEGATKIIARDRPVIFIEAARSGDYGRELQRVNKVMKGCGYEPMPTSFGYPRAPVRLYVPPEKLEAWRPEHDSRRRSLRWALRVEEALRYNAQLALHRLGRGLLGPPRQHRLWPEA